jgi:MFS transporter, CP family, cyanate transporter
MHVGCQRRVYSMSTSPSRDGRETGGLAKLLCLLFLAGVAMRLTLLAVPPVIPLVHEDLHLSETQIGLLVGLPLAVFAIAAIPGSLLITRIGATSAATVGLAIAAIGGAARGAAIDVWTLYAAAIVAGFGIAIMQPGMPMLVREWMPARIGSGTIAYSSGMVTGATLPPSLTLAFMLPLARGSWRLDLVLWAVLAAIITVVFLALSPKGGGEHRAIGVGPSGFGALWWPDWKSPLVWLLGFAFGGNSGAYFAANAFLGDYLVSRGQGDVLGVALGALNGAQLCGLVILIAMARRLQRRAWPFLVFGPAILAAFLGFIFIPTPVVVVICCMLIGISTSVTMTPLLALPPLLVEPADVSRTAAGMLTISYTCAIIIPTICGALWDLTGKSWTTFILPCVCCVGLTVTGALAARHPSAAEKLSLKRA